MRILNDSPLAQKYGFSEKASAAAPTKLAEILKLIDRRLEQQKANGSDYLVGDGVSAADIYWATISMSVSPVPTEIMPETKQNKGMLAYFASNSNIPAVAEVLTDRIGEHQRYILSTYCETPAAIRRRPRLKRSTPRKRILSRTIYFGNIHCLSLIRSRNLQDYSQSACSYCDISPKLLEFTIKTWFLLSYSESASKREFPLDTLIAKLPE